MDKITLTIQCSEATAFNIEKSIKQQKIEVQTYSSSVKSVRFDSIDKQPDVILNVVTTVRDIALIISAIYNIKNHYRSGGEITLKIKDQQLKLPLNTPQEEVDKAIEKLKKYTNTLEDNSNNHSDD
ncbi:hypothetical protein [Planktothrix sp.]|uniref:hypothetical protein n=1 Tax=Planktothrix sp. TaxID=3088171 RepID=UPI0038D4508D